MTNNLDHMFSQHILQRVEDAERERIRRIHRAWEMYEGHHAKPLKVKPNEPDDNVTVNYTGLTVDKGVSFLFGEDDLQFELDATRNTEAEQWLEAAWAENQKMDTLYDLGTNGGVAGHAFAKIDWQPGQQFPELSVLDPATVFVRWDPHNLRRVLSYRIEYEALDENGRPRSYRQLIERDGSVWRITDQEKDPDARAWLTVNETRWNYPWPTVVDCKNLPAPNEYWGRSDIEEHVQRLNDSINFLLSNINRIIKIHGHPKTWINKLVRGLDVNIGVDGVIQIPGEGELHNLEMISDLAGHIAYYQRLREAYHEITRIPEVASGKLESTGNLSGTALGILYRPIVEITGVKRFSYGGLITRLNRRMLALGGYGENLTTRTHWPEILPKDMLQERQAYMLDDQMGVVSKSTISAQLGYDWDTEKGKIAEERDASQQVASDMLTQFDRGQ